MPFPSASSGDEGCSIKDLLSTLLRKELIERPPQYTVGANFDKHLQRLNSFLDSINVKDDPTKSAILFTTLSDNVAAEFRCHPDFQEEATYKTHVDLLRFMFRTKESPISPLLKLLEIRQKQGQSLREYISELRVAAADIVNDPTERERLLVSAFVNGLLDSNLVIALKAMSPKTLDDAHKLIKNEVKNSRNNNECSIRLLECKENINNDCNFRQELENIKTELVAVKTNLKVVVEMLGGNRNNRTQLSKQNLNMSHQKDFRKQPKFTPFNKRSNYPVKCYNCNRDGHIARFCNFERKQVRIRQVKDEENNDQQLSEREISEKESETDFFIVDVKVPEAWPKRKSYSFPYTDLRNDSKFNNSKTEMSKHSFKKMKKEKIISQNKTVNKIDQSGVDKNLISWINYIDGKGRKPKCETVISNSYSEKARNKPIVKGQIEGKSGKIFCDSGAEVNLINSEIAFELQKYDPNINIFSRNLNIKCANGTTMSNKGAVILTLQLGGIISKQEFILVDNLFPRVIIGIRTMKDIGLKIEPEHDCIRVQGNVIPFISKVDAIKIRPENDSQSLLSAGN